MSFRIVLITKTIALVLLGAALVLLVAAPFVVQLMREPGTPVPYQHEAAAELIAAGQYGPAYRSLLHTDAAALKPRERARLEYQLAVCERMLDHPERARARLERLEHAVPVLEDYRLYWIARSLEDLGRDQAAVAAYLEFLSRCRHPELADLGRMRLAELYSRTEAHDEALRLYRQLTDSDTVQEAEILYRLGRIHGERGAHEQQRREWLQLARRFPAERRALQAVDSLSLRREPAELNVRAAVYLEHHRYSAAMGVLRAFLGAHPHHKLADRVQYQLARAYAGLGRYQEAVDTYRAVFRDSGRPSALYRIAGLQVRSNKDREAIATYRTFVRLFPRHALADHALWRAAKASERYDDFDAAGQLYRHLVERYPDSELRDEAGWSSGFMYYCRHEYRKALEVFQRQSRMAVQPHIVDQSLFWAGKAAAELGLDAVADTHYRRAADGFPRSYYSSRAVALGYARPPALQPRPESAAFVVPREEPGSMAGTDYVLRADILAALGLRELARRELEHAETRNAGMTAALRAIRDRYEAYGMLANAMRLSVRIFAAAGSGREIHHIYPAYYWNEVAAAAKEAALDPYLILSVIRQESSFNPRARSRVGALGLMQLMPQTGGSLARALGLNPFELELLLDPEVSIRLGSHFLGEQVRDFAAGAGGAMPFELGLAAYNAGPHNARRWLKRLPNTDTDAFVERIPYHETRKYVKLVLKNYTIYKALSDA